MRVLLIRLCQAVYHIHFARWYYIFILSVLSACCSAQQIVNQGQDPVARLRVAQALAKLGFQQGLTCTTLAHIVFSNDPTTSLSLTLRNKGGDVLATELQTAAGSRLIVTRSGEARMRSPKGKIATLSTENSNMETVAHFPAFSVLSKLDTLTGTYSLSRSGDGQDLITMSIPRIFSSGSLAGTVDKVSASTNVQIFLDPLTSFITRLSKVHYSEQSEKKFFTVDTYFEQYTMFGTLAVPRRQRILENGKQAAEVTIDNVDCQTPVPDSYFTFDRLTSGGSK